LKDDLGGKNVLSKNLRNKLEAALGLLGDIRVRWLIGRSQALLESGSISEKELESLMKRIMREELERWLIIKQLEKKGPLTIRQISKETSLPEPLIVEHVIALGRLGRITTIGEKENGYLYDLSK
jgi:hypothetical protein